MSVSSMIYELNRMKFNGKVDINSILNEYYKIIPKDEDDYYSKLARCVSKVYIDNKRLDTNKKLSGIAMDLDPLEYLEEKMEKLRKEVLDILDYYENTTIIDWGVIQKKFMEFMNLSQLISRAKEDKRIEEQTRDVKVCQEKVARDIEELRVLIDIVPIHYNNNNDISFDGKMPKGEGGHFILEFARFRSVAFGRTLEVALDLIDQYDSEREDCLDLDDKGRFVVASMGPISEGFLSSLVDADNTDSMIFYRELLEDKYECSVSVNEEEMNPLVRDYIDLAYTVKYNNKVNVRVLSE